MEMHAPASGNIRVFDDPGAGTQSAAEWLVQQLSAATTRNVMLAGGNTPLGLYAAIATRQADLSHLNIFALDEYVGVPLEEPRNCANLIRACAVKPWSISENQYHWISSLETEATESIRIHEEKIRDAGGLDLVLLGLGRNGHVGFNEPGSDADSKGRMIGLDEVSVEANREWFQGELAPSLGVTTGMELILAAKQILLLAFGRAKTVAVARMLEDAPSAECPASLLQFHPNVHYILDSAAAADLNFKLPSV